MHSSILPPNVRVFTISPRTVGLPDYWNDIRNTVSWSDHYGYTGVLIFTGNDALIEPWIVAQYILDKSQNLSPLVAINPVYMHPFTSAKMVSSLVYLYKRTLYLNLVAGVALNFLNSVGCNQSHDQRYQRLGEYVHIMRELFRGKPVTFSGQFYRIQDLQLLPALPVSRIPDLFLAGQSEAARSLSVKMNILAMKMLPKSLAPALGTKGMHFGIVTREFDYAARKAALLLFPKNDEGQELLDHSIANTDAVWKKTLRKEAESNDIEESGFWLGPFLNFKADCPYFVGGYETVAELIVSLVTSGVTTIILDIFPSEEEYHHLSMAFKLAKVTLASCGPHNYAT